MAQESTAQNSPQQDGNGVVQPAGKIVISSVVTHESLIDAIKQRNPIIAGRTEAER
jgi:hypothetical protein